MSRNNVRMNLLSQATLDRNSDGEEVEIDDVNTDDGEDKLFTPNKKQKAPFSAPVESDSFMSGLEASAAKRSEEQAKLCREDRLHEMSIQEKQAESQDKQLLTIVDKASTTLLQYVNSTKVKTPQEEYNAAIEEYKQYLSDGTWDKKRYDRCMARARQNMVDSS
jgi:hypothetical protein